MKPAAPAIDTQPFGAARERRDQRWPLKNESLGLGLTQELSALLGVSDVDQGHGSLADALAPQIRHSVFGHHAVHVSAAGDDSGAGLECGCCGLPRRVC